MIKFLCILLFIIFSKFEASHTFLPITDLIQGYNEHISTNKLSISICKIYDYNKKICAEYDPPSLNAHIQLSSFPSRIYRTFHFLICDDANKEVGVMHLREDANKIEGAHFYISGIYIHEKSQGKGYGTQALKELINLFEAINPYCQDFSLKINSKNPKAGFVYARAGFWLADYYRDYKPTEDFEKFAELILDQTQVTGPKIMVHNRGDDLLDLSSKKSKEQIIKSLETSALLNLRKI